MNVDWIPCSEMMPEIGREVLFIKVFNTGKRAVCKGSTRENPRGFVEWFSCDTQQFDFKDYTFKWSLCPARQVTHWMPLPNLPDVKTANWIPYGRDSAYTKFFRCSECGYEIQEYAEEVQPHEYAECPSCHCEMANSYITRREG